jgi:hypothetical protein
VDSKQAEDDEPTYKPLKNNAPSPVVSSSSSSSSSSELWGIAVDGARVWVSDWAANMILCFESASLEDASVSSSSSSSSAAAAAGVGVIDYSLAHIVNGSEDAGSGLTLAEPRGLTVDSTTHRLFVADAFQRRVLVCKYLHRVYHFCVQ